MLNKVMIIGRLGQDPELRYTQNGAAVVSLRVATDESYVDSEGSKVERVEWHRVSAFQRQAENCAEYLAKGSLIFVEGSLQTRKWQDQAGQDRYVTEIKAFRIQFLDRRSSESSEDTPVAKKQTSKRKQKAAAQSYNDGYPEEASGMDQIPF